MNSETIKALQTKLVEVSQEVDKIAKEVDSVESEVQQVAEQPAPQAQAQPEPEPIIETDEGVVNLKTQWKKIDTRSGCVRYYYRMQDPTVNIDGDTVSLHLTADKLLRANYRYKRDPDGKLTTQAERYNVRWEDVRGGTLKAWSGANLEYELDQVNGVEVDFRQSDKNPKIFYCNLNEDDYNKILAAEGVPLWVKPPFVDKPKQWPKGKTMELAMWQSDIDWMTKQRDNWSLEINYVGFEGLKENEDDIHAIYEKTVVEWVESVNKRFVGLDTPTCEEWAKVASYWNQSNCGVAYDTDPDRGEKDHKPQERVAICLKYGISGGLRDLYFYRPGDKPSKVTVDRMSYEKGGFYPERIDIFPIQKVNPVPETDKSEKRKNEGS